MFDKASAVIRDGSRLAFDYVPEKIVGRETQMKQLEMIFRPMVFENRPCTAFLYGGVGTGKTVTARRFCEDMNAYCARSGRLLDMMVINCRIRNSEFSVLLQMMRYFDKGYPDRGFSAEEMLRALKQHIESRTRPLIIVLDEVDVLLKNSSRNLVYQLTRLNEEMAKSSISLIMVSQTPLVEMLDEASQSTFKRANALKFERYGRDELHAIITARADEALVTGALGRPEADLLSDISAQYGDARLAIELIERAATIAETHEGGRITADDIRTANAMIYSDVSESKLKDLDTNHKLALLSISRAIKDNVAVPMSTVEKTYAVVCEEYEQTARKHTQFWTYVQNMEKLGLVTTEMKVEADRGRITFISVPNIPPRELAKKLEYLLETPDFSNKGEWRR